MTGRLRAAPRARRLRVLAAAAALVVLGGGTHLASSATAQGAAPQSGQTAAAQGGPVVSAEAILEMALEAPRLIDYEGTKVITTFRNGRPESVTVAESHKRPNLLRLEYLSPEDVAGRLIVDDGTTAWHYEPNLNLAFEGATLQSRLLSGDHTLLHRNYTLVMLGTDEAIGRQAYVIALEPRGAGVSRTLWVDRATGTVLRSEARDPSRGVVLSTYFSRISFSLNLPESYFQFRLPAGARIFPMRTQGESLSPAALERQVGFPVLTPPVLPEGYTFRGGAVSRFGSLTSASLRYSDGGNVISFFEAPAGSIGWPALGRPMQVNARPGRFIDLGYLRVLIWEQRGLRVTAVGTVPTETLAAVAGQIAAGREQALVRDVSDRSEADPATVQKLRGQGLTFPEIARTLALQQMLGTDQGTTVRFVRGAVTLRDLAKKLGTPVETLRQKVRDATQQAAAITPVHPPAPPAPPGPSR